MPRILVQYIVTSRELLRKYTCLLMHIYLEKHCVMFKCCLNEIHTVMSQLEKNMPDGEGTERSMS